MTKEILELLAWCETEMRYAGWINPRADNPQRHELYIAVEQALAQPVQQVQRQPLTEAQIDNIRFSITATHHTEFDRKFTRAIEAAHNIGAAE